MVTEMFYGEQQTLELIEGFYGRAEWSMVSLIQRFTVIHTGALAAPFIYWSIPKIY